MPEIGVVAAQYIRIRNRLVLARNANDFASLELLDPNRRECSESVSYMPERLPCALTQCRIATFVSWPGCVKAACLGQFLALSARKLSGIRNHDISVVFSVKIRH